MKTKRTGNLAQPTLLLDFVTLTERHLDDWLSLLDQLQDAHAPTDQLVYCRNQVTRLQLELYQLRDTRWLANADQLE